MRGGGNLRLGQMRRCKQRIRLPLRRRKPRLPPMYSANLRQCLYLRQRLRRRMRVRRLDKRKFRKRQMNYAACSFASGAAARILRRIGFAGIAALLGALSRPLRMRGRKSRRPLLCRRMRGRKPRLPLQCRQMRRRNLRRPLLCRRMRGRKPRPPLRQYLRLRMRARRGRKGKVRRRGMYRRNFR